MTESTWRIQPFPSLSGNPVESNREFSASLNADNVDHAGATRSLRQTKSGNKRMTQSCDNCRKKKIRCDARQPSCANCENLGLSCQTLRAARKRGRKAQGPPASTTDVYPPDQSQGQPSPVQVPHRFAEQQILVTSSASEHIPRRWSSIEDQHQEGQSFPQISSPRISDDNHVHHYCNNAFLQSDHTGMGLSPTIYDSPYSETCSHSFLNDLAQRLMARGVMHDPVSYMATCIDIFFQNIYPTYPVLYRPAMDAALESLKQRRDDSDCKSFALITSACAYTLAVLPEPLNPGTWAVAETFYYASKKALASYADADIEKPDHTSIVIRMFHSGWIHVEGKKKASWNILGQCIRIAQSMRLHDERSYANMSYREGQLCRRAFWTLYTGDKSSAVLGGHPMCLKDDTFEGGINVQYPEDFADQDTIFITTHRGERREMSIMAGFNANQTLWRAAEALLVIDSRDVLRVTEDSHDVPARMASKSPKLLANRFMHFHTCLDGLPSILCFHNRLSTSREDFFFADQASTIETPKAIAIQRTNLQISYQCLKLIVLRRFPSFHLNQATGAFNAPLSSSNQSPRMDSSVEEANDHNTPSYILEILRIAHDMLYVIQTSSLELIRLNGEACVEKIRLVGASILELIAQNPSSTLISTARDYRELYPHILAMLDSKASDSAERQTAS